MSHLGYANALVVMKKSGQSLSRKTSVGNASKALFSFIQAKRWTLAVQMWQGSIPYETSKNLAIIKS
jgi:hypothetical protein